MCKAIPDLELLLSMSVRAEIPNTRILAKKMLGGDWSMAMFGDKTVCNYKCSPEDFTEYPSSLDDCPEEDLVIGRPSNVLEGNTARETFIIFANHSVMTSFIFALWLMHLFDAEVECPL